MGDRQDNRKVQDLHFKMSKKIAQLTKVIYHLNTVNDDHESEKAAITTQHNEEVQQILSDAADKIKRFESQLQERKEERKTELALEELRKQYEREKQDAKEDFREFCEKQRKHQEELEQKYQEELQQAQQKNGRNQRKIRATTG
eukprot:gb/GECG01000452.1/.p1 GENE.gb/GECG01000452.1/~~gb/GECG01000452.1/.p1  ORF type:complete len:144 (+),score=40.30 gb/GECG01000452.1/:1-432(+)